MTENDEWKSNYGLIIICNCMSSLAAAPLARHVYLTMDVLNARCLCPLPAASRLVARQDQPNHERTLCEMLSMISNSICQKTPCYRVAYKKIIYKSGDIYSIYFFSFFHFLPLSLYIYKKKCYIIYIFFCIYYFYIQLYIH